MSSILEALKKLEADKNLQSAPVENSLPPTSDPFHDNSAFDRFSKASQNSRISPVALVVGGGIFSILLIAVSVFLAMLLVDRGQPAVPLAALPPAPGAQSAPAPQPAAASEAAPSEALSIQAAPVEAQAIEVQPADIPETDAAPAATAVARVPEPMAPVKMVQTPIELPKASVAPVQAPPAPTPAQPEPPKASEERVEVASLIPAATDYDYERYVPEPEPDRQDKKSSAPVPDDIRRLPMLSRSERDQFRLDDVKINMLNEESALRPLGNAIINLEKVFIGETLPGTNARLIDVKNHGIAVEIISTRQQYYIPR